MTYIKLDTLEYPVFEGEIRLRFPLTCFPTPFVPPEGYAIVENTPPPSYDRNTQRLEENSPELVDEVWVKRWTITNLTESELSARLSKKRESMKVTPLQAQLVLLQNNLLDTVQALIDDPETSQSIKLAWNKAS